MTRINCGINPKELTRQHLLAEAREIKRVPNIIKKTIESGKSVNFKGQPKKFTLGTGHVKFFYDKLLYLQKRYEELYAECKRRGFNVIYYGDAWKDVPENLMNDYSPTDEDREIIRERIIERLSS